MTCRICLSSFSYDKPTGKRGRMRRFCSIECKKVAGAACNRRKGDQITCKKCGIIFFRSKYQKNSGLCSQACWSPLSRKIYEDTAHREREASRRKRARKRDALVEHFHEREIYERDNWICRICWMPVNKSARRPNKMCASLDHIIPLSRGGMHERSNVQLAHWLCNSQKTWLLPTEFAEKIDVEF